MNRRPRGLIDPLQNSIYDVNLKKPLTKILYLSIHKYPLIRDIHTFKVLSTIKTEKIFKESIKNIPLRLKKMFSLRNNTFSCVQPKSERIHNYRDIRFPTITQHLLQLHKYLLSITFSVQSKYIYIIIITVQKRPILILNHQYCS